ncbi:cache domain-containing protein [Sporomusa ovata]|uniref:Methyl-accepting chemotaxis protein n=1 Tax=Sporomusa ovata TaxID=2378 RepID=A0A0U1KUG1_9FIRM|nr:cache domain-containing protein [Sporomusa ovata]CQR71037.1 Methyl-accepting chemotaxis protein [Sporomusa ovata]
MQFSIRHQLTLIICSLILLAMVSTLMISHFLISEDYESKMQYNLQTTTESLAFNIAQFMQNAYNVNQLIAEYPDLKNLDSQKQYQLLTEIKRKYPFYQVLTIQDLNGDQTAKTSGSLVNRSERWWFKKFIAERQPYISQSYYSVFSDSPVTSIIQGIYSQGKLYGILLADIEIKQLQQMVETYSAGGESYAYLLDGEGVVIAHPDRQQAAELYNYKTMKKKVLLRDLAGIPLRDEKITKLRRKSPLNLRPLCKLSLLRLRQARSAQENTSALMARSICVHTGLFPYRESPNPGA